MNGILKAAVAVAATLIATSALAGHGDHQRYCRITPSQEWKSPKDIAAQAEQDGYDVLELHAKHGCWKIEAIDKSRHRVDVIYDPSGKLLWIDD